MLFHHSHYHSGSHTPSTGLSRNNSDASQYGGSYNSYSSAPSPISPTHYSPSQVSRFSECSPSGELLTCYCPSQASMVVINSTENVFSFQCPSESNISVFLRYHCRLQNVDVFHSFTNIMRFVQLIKGAFYFILQPEKHFLPAKLRGACSPSSHRNINCSEVV